MSAQQIRHYLTLLEGVLTEEASLDKLIARLRGVFELQKRGATDGERESATNAYTRIIKTITDKFGSDAAQRAEALVSGKAQQSTYDRTRNSAAAAAAMFSGDIFSYIEAELDRFDRERETERNAPYGKQHNDEKFAAFLRRILPTPGETVEVQFQVGGGSPVPDEWAEAVLVSVTADQWITLRNKGIQATFELQGDCFGRDKTLSRLWAVLICDEKETDDGHEIAFDNPAQEALWETFFGEGLRLS